MRVYQAKYISSKMALKSGYTEKETKVIISIIPASKIEEARKIKSCAHQ